MKDIRINGSNLIVSDQKKVYVYNLSGALVKTLDIAEEVNTANIVNNQIYTGTQFSGIYDEAKNSYIPDGPYSNISYKVNLLDNQIWVATGGRDDYLSLIHI